MKKLLLLCIPLVFFFGCEEDNSNNDVNTCLIEGTWSLETYDELNGEYLTCFCEYVSGACEVFDKDCIDFVFEPNNYFHSLYNGEFEGGGTWDADCSEIESGAIVTLNLDAIPGTAEASIWEMEIQSISSNNMILNVQIEYEEDGGGYGGIITFSKVD